MAEPKIIESTLNQLEKCHPCIGAIIIRDNQILMIDRKKFPFGWACVAGHIDEGEEPEKSLFREVQEESGLNIIDYQLLFEEEINNPCRRGINYHYWYVYECKVSGEIIKNYEETNDIKWIDLDRIKELTLEPVWEYLFKQIL
jgi:ADP-ribose pyrophosphatase YjhB (NUDIX family)